MLIPEWRTAWRMFSVQLAGVAVLFGALPEETQAAVLGLVGVPQSRISAVLGLLIIVARVVQQPKVRTHRPPAGSP